MIVGLDSSFERPTPEIVTNARAAGVQLWSGYLATQPNVGLASPWDQASFDVARLCGAMPIAFCSGWDDPSALAVLAASWKVRLCLDVESGIRPDGPWVQGWLDQSGAGLYGSCSVHDGRRAAFHILAWYLGQDPDSTWYDAACPRPSGPCGWQWQGPHREFGVDVDRGWYDDWFGVTQPKEVPMTYLIQGDRDGAQGGSGAVYVTNWIWKRHVQTPAELQALGQFLGAVQTVPQAVIDAVPAS